MTKKKFAELELSLLHLHQNVEIPEKTLVVHPIVSRAVEQVRGPLLSPPSSAGIPRDSPGIASTWMLQCRAEGITRITIDAIQPSSLLSDSAFLSKLQSDVSSWVKDIQSITKLDRDVPSGTASQEINFWISMERALEGIKAQLKSDPIVLELDVLKHAKRFHATVSFDSDTGLTEMTTRGEPAALGLLAARSHACPICCSRRSSPSPAFQSTVTASS